MARVPNYALSLLGVAHVFYTGFNWSEIVEIHKAVTRCFKAYYDDPYPNGFDYPEYGDLPKAISKRLTSEQVDYLWENWYVGAGVRQCAILLARGWNDNVR